MYLRSPVHIAAMRTPELQNLAMYFLYVFQASTLQPYSTAVSYGSSIPLACSSLASSSRSSVPEYQQFLPFCHVSSDVVSTCWTMYTSYYKKKWNIYCEKSMSSRTTESSMKTQYHVSIYRFAFIYTLQKISGHYKWMCRLYIVSSPSVITLLITINWNI